MSAPNPSWYDMLGVDQDASADEIRAAWKAGIADLDPTDRRFRLLNQAAEILLDPEQRAPYDRTLDQQEAPAQVAPLQDAPAEVAPPVTRPKWPPDPRQAEPDPGAIWAGSPETEVQPPPTSATPPERTTSPRVIPGWLLAGLAILTVIFVGLSIWQAQNNQDDEQRQAATSSSGDATPDEAREAQSVAEKAVLAITSYDYRDLDGSRAAAVAYMTDDYRKTKYEPLFALIQQNAPEVKPIVTAEGVASAVGLIGGGKVQVLVFFDRTTNNAAAKNQISRDQATLTMTRVGGEWLVDDLTTTLPGA